jgi:hypothetical protein
MGLRHLQAAIAARVDRGERRQIHVHVQAQPVIAAAVLEAQAERGDLAAVHVDARRIGTAFRWHAVCCQQGNNRAFHAIHQLAHRQALAFQIQQQVNDDLAGAVVSDLAAAVGAYQWNVIAPRQSHVLAVEAQRVHRRMLGQPEFVRRFGSAFGSKSPHGFPRRLVIG